MSEEAARSVNGEPIRAAGQVGRLKSGGPPFTVTSIDEVTENVEFVWFDGVGSLRKGEAKLCSMTRLDDGQARTEWELRQPKYT